MDDRRKRRLAVIGAAILFLIEVGLQVSGVTSLPLAITVWGVAGILFLYWLSHAVNDWQKHRRQHGMAGLESWYFIIPCFVVAVLAIAATAYGLGLRSTAALAKPTETSQSASNSQPQNSTLAQPEYLKNVHFSSIQKTTGPTVVYFNAEVNLTSDRLRFFVDYDSFRAGSYFFASPTRVPLGERTDLVRAQKLNEIPIILIDQNSTSDKIYWGEPRLKYGVGDLNHARLVILGNDGREQHIYFEVIRTRVYSPSDVEVLNEEDVERQWIKDWQARNP